MDRLSSAHRTIIFLQSKSDNIWKVVFSENLIWNFLLLTADLCCLIQLNWPSPILIKISFGNLIPGFKYWNICSVFPWNISLLKNESCQCRAEYSVYNLDICIWDPEERICFESLFCSQFSVPSHAIIFIHYLRFLSIFAPFYNLKSTTVPLESTSTIYTHCTKFCPDPEHRSQIIDENSKNLSFILLRINFFVFKDFWRR